MLIEILNRQSSRRGEACLAQEDFGLRDPQFGRRPRFRWARQASPLRSEEPRFEALEPRSRYPASGGVIREERVRTTCSIS